ncbi:SpoIIE family protein phosphatase [Streptomyces iakyrus]|uniref:SpoIIE family protein phosphatase n=1 Tax=Streptomyces iakyrus TaxID=68219 RepID=UPI003409BB8F
MPSDQAGPPADSGSTGSAPQKAERDHPAANSAPGTEAVSLRVAPTPAGAAVPSDQAGPPADSGSTGSAPQKAERDHPAANGAPGTEAVSLRAAPTPAGAAVPGDQAGPPADSGSTGSAPHRAGRHDDRAAAAPGPGAASQNRSLPVAGVRAGGVNIPYGGAEYSGDAWGWVRAGDRVTLMLADGLGHGPEAARASSAAVTALHRWAHLSPAESLRRLHDALRDTRGAAVAVAQLDLSTGRLRFAGIGNVGARLRTGGAWRALLSRPGIVGVHRPATLREEEADWSDDPLLILHTDGLPSRWTPPSGPGLPSSDPAVTAAVTIRDASSPALPVRDDTAVAVLTSTPPEHP